MELAITGVGIVSGLGVGREAFHSALSDAAAARAKAFRGASEVLEAFPDANTAEVWDWDPKPWLGDKGHRNNDQLTKYLIAAAKQALIDAGIKDAEGVFLRYADQQGVEGELVALDDIRAAGGDVDQEGRCWGRREVFALFFCEFERCARLLDEGGGCEEEDDEEEHDIDHRGEIDVGQVRALLRVAAH